MDKYSKDNNYPKNFKATIDRYNLNEKFFHNKKDGVFIELGAIDGIYISNSKYFEDNFNWNGILIEPNNFEFQKLVKNRPNCKLFNNIISNDKNKIEYVYYQGHHMAAVSGVKKSLTESHNEKYFKDKKYLSQLLEPKTLTEIIKSTDFKYFDLLSLDVEGHELEVLQSWDFSIPIKIILIEMTHDNYIKNEKCRNILLKNNYKLDHIHENKRDEIYILNE